MIATIVEIVSCRWHNKTVKLMVIKMCVTAIMKENTHTNTKIVALSLFFVHLNERLACL